MSIKDGQSSFLSTGNLRNRSHSAQKYLEKKLQRAKRFVVSGKIWRNAIPTRNTEIVLLFPSKTEESTLMWLLGRMRARVPDLKVSVRKHAGNNCYGFYLTTSYDIFLRGAEELGIRKPVKEILGGGIREFLYLEQEEFAGIEDPATFFTSLEKQSIVNNLLNGLRAQAGDILDDIKFVDGQPIIPTLLSRNIISQVFPLHHSERLHELNKSWVWSFFKSQPLDDICNYFGVKISLYFAWLGHYTRALIFPALIGLILFMDSGKTEARDDFYFVLFSFLNIIWATVYLESWKRRCAELSFQWGTLDKEEDLLAEPRSLYKGDLITSPVTGRLERLYPLWKTEVVIAFIGFPVTFVCLCVTLSTMFLFFEFQEWVNSKNVWSVISILPMIILAIIILIYEDIYKRIAIWLNNKENFRLEETYQNHLIMKLTLFHFVNSFSSLFYMAFYLQDMNRLRDLLGALLITRQIVNNAKEILMPYLYEKAKLYKVGYFLTKDLSPDTLTKELADIKQECRNYVSGDGSCGNSSEESDASLGDDCDRKTGKLQLTQAEVESSKQPYDDAFDDYLEMFVQFGYVTFFSSAFPLAACFALLNNVIEIRSDAFKLCNSHQRPFGQTAKTIGMWQDCLHLMSTFAVMINCALIGLSGQVQRLFPNLSPGETILYIVILEHILVAIKFGIAYAIPDVPLSIKIEMAKIEFKRREALRKLEQTSMDAQNSSPLGKTDFRYSTESGSKTCSTSGLDVGKTLNDSSSEMKVMFNDNNTEENKFQEDFTEGCEKNMHCVGVSDGSLEDGFKGDEALETADNSSQDLAIKSVDILNTPTSDHIIRKRLSPPSQRRYSSPSQYPVKETEL